MSAPNEPLLPLVAIPGYMLDETLWDALRAALAAPAPAVRAQTSLAAAAPTSAAPAPAPMSAAPAASSDLAAWQPRDLVHVPLAGGATIAEMARTALAAAPAGRFDLLGFSMGGYVAREIARIAPDRVRSLILVATSSRADTPLQISQRQTAAKAKPLGTFRGLGRVAIIHSLHPKHASDAQLIDQVRLMGERLGRETFIEQSMIVRDSDTDQLQQIQCPTLVIAAAQDQMRSAEEASELAAGIPGARLETIEDAGHMIPLEQPARLAQLLQAWLAAR